VLEHGGLDGHVASEAHHSHLVEAGQKVNPKKPYVDTFHVFSNAADCSVEKSFCCFFRFSVLHAKFQIMLP
jgi:hypothetical protein